MAVLLLVLLLCLPTFLLGLLIWTICKHFLTRDVPSTLEHPVKFRILDCVFIYVITLGNILEKLRISSMPCFARFVQDRLFLKKKDSKVVITDLHFGTIPVRLFQPKAMSHCSRGGIIFYHGGAAVLGSLDFYHNVCLFLALETNSVLLSVGYRKLPDHHYPVITKDCLNTTIHFLKRLETYGVDPSRVVICGESAGGGTAAQIIQILVDRKDLPKIRAQVLIHPIIQAINYQLPSTQQNQNVPFLTRDFMLMCICRYMAIDLSWKDAMLNGACIPPETWKKYRKWLSSDNIPKRFKDKYKEPQFPGPFNESAYLETKHLFDVENSPLLADDQTIAQLPEAFLVSCEHDVLRDHTLLYKKRLEDQGVPVSWYHVEDGFHGCILLFDRQPFSFSCSQKVVNAVASYIKGL
ncbi:PREDICTED: arylacetamide deacetylase-like 4 [Chinchilla lanigera]|uniref:Arylacetamide deacetylase-like 4 n=1 Tax=Chinchilla lanigera TaxID=34839 RepID=A0A8C2V2K5_CHILA|nr:PREDICTED: arylacetamide deacetylase-like 4 [Chinchilla lanigera]